jgi:hypothetical protein
MKIISFEDIRDLNITPQTCLQWVSDMIANKKEALLPAKISMKPVEKIFCNVMPCILKGEKKQWGGGENCHQISRPGSQPGQQTAIV